MNAAIWYNAVVPYGITLYLHAAILLSVSLSVSNLARKLSPIMNAFILQMTLAAILLTPLYTGVISQYIPEIPVINIPIQNLEDYVQQSVLDSSPEHSLVQVDNEYVLYERTGRFQAQTQMEMPPRDHKPVSAFVVSMIFLFLSLIWPFLSAYYAVRLIVGMISLNRLRKRSFSATPEYEKMCRSIAQTLDIHAPAILQNVTVTVPFVCGIKNPCLILPMNMNMCDSEVHDILLHEIAHVKRRDNMWLLLGQLVSILVPLLPLVHVLRRKLDELSDLACDDLVVMHGRNNRFYAKSLLDFIVNHHKNHRMMASHLTGSSGFFRRRLERILKSRSVRIIAVNAYQACAVTVFFVGAVIINGFVTFSVDCIPLPENILTLQSSDFSYFSQVLHMPGRNANSHDGGKSGNTAAVKKYEPKQLYTETNLSIPQRIAPHMNSVGKAIELPDMPVRKVNNSQRLQDDDKLTYRGIYNAFNVAGAERDIVEDIDIGAIRSFSGNNGAGVSEFNRMAMIPEDFHSLMSLTPLAKSAHRMSATSNQLNPVWSPDGSKIAFTDGKYGIWVVDIEREIPTLVYNNFYAGIQSSSSLSSAGSLETFCFTPDGNSVLFQSYVIDENRGTEVVREYDEISKTITFEIRNPVPIVKIVNITTGSSRTYMDSAQSLCLSHNGRYAAYRTYQFISDEYPEDVVSNNELAIYDFMTKQKRVLTDDDILPLDIRFTPDDAGLIVSGKSGGDNEHVRLFYISFDGSEKRELSQGRIVGRHYGLTVSGDGRIWFSNLNASQPSLVSYQWQHDSLVEIALPSQAVQTSLSLDCNDLCAVFHDQDTSRYLLYVANLDPSLVAAVDVPHAFALKGNYPNPFNAETMINFSLQEESYTVLTVYNLAGQKVRDLVNESLPPGEHRVRWDGHDAEGRKVATGLYIARLTAGSHIATHKMVLLK